MNACTIDRTECQSDDMQVGAGCGRTAQGVGYVNLPCLLQMQTAIREEGVPAAGFRLLMPRYCAQALSCKLIGSSVIAAGPKITGPEQYKRAIHIMYDL